MKKLQRIFPIFCIFLFLVLMLCFPEQCTSGAAAGLLLCGRVIVPSLFPFTVCTLFLMRSGTAGLSRILHPVSKWVFALNGRQFIVLLLSMIGGYPVGAKLIAELYRQKAVSEQNARLLQCCCVNAGPAFIVLAVGSSVIGSKTIGYLLLCTHILSAFILSAVIGRFMCPEDAAEEAAEPQQSMTDNFVEAAADAAGAVLGICGYVILFATLNAYITFGMERLPSLRLFQLIAEVTTAVSTTDNIYLISFLLGFSGLSVWCQVASVSRKTGMNLPLFCLARILHGALSAAGTYMIVRFAGITVPVFKNNVQISPASFHSTAALAVSLIIMTILLLITLNRKNATSNIKKDLI